MIAFTQRQKNKAENIFKMLRKQTPEFLEEKQITKCDHCDGTGLNATKLDGQSGYSWADTNSYCDKCYGVGYLGYDKSIDFDGTKYMCPVCQSVGCKDCEDTGFVDWITHIMGKGKHK